MILFIHRTLLSALDPIIGGFQRGGIVGGVTAISQAILAPQKQRVAERRAVRSLAASRTAVGNIQGFSVASLGATSQPVGGAVLRPPFTRAVQQPAFSTLGNVPLGPVPVGFRPTPLGGRLFGLGAGAAGAGAAFSKVRSTIAEGFASGLTRPGLPRLTRAERGLPVAQDNGRPNFARDECGNILKFYCSQRLGEGWIQITDQNRSEARKPFARFNQDTQMFVRMPRRRMNPLNIRALGRATKRNADFMDIVLPMIKQRNAEKAGRRPFVRTGAAARKGAKRRRKKVRC